MELNRFNRVLRQVLILPVAALLLLAAAVVWQFRASDAMVARIEQSDRRIALAILIQRLTVDEETGLRGYQTTRDLRFLQPYLHAEGPMQAAIAELQSVQDSLPDQSDHLRQFVAEHQMWHSAFAEPLIAALAAGADTRDVSLNLQGKQHVDTMRAHLNAIVAAAEQHRADRIRKWHDQVRFVLTGLILLTLAVGLSIGLFTRDRMHAVSRAFRKALTLQRTRAEELFQSEQQLRTTLASIGDAVIACDREGRVQTMNPVAQQLTGWTENEARQLSLQHVFHIVNETTRQPVENPVEEVNRLDRIVSLANHTLLIRRDGSEITIDHNGSPIRNAAGELTGAVMVFRDITMERKTRAALLANEKLAVAGRLAATIAHEIHNPLDSVSNLLFLLGNGSTPEESAQFVQIAQAELARVTQISRAMLSLYRESVAPVAVDLKDTLEDLLALMKGRFHDLGVTTSTELPNGISVDGFPAELRQVFTNLLSNAAEATGPGGHVHVRVFPRQPEDSASPPVSHQPLGATVEITDDGPGIDPAVRDHLFQPFVTTKGQNGTGLGLWVSQGIIRKHAGTLELNSLTGNGHHGTIASVFLAAKPILNLGGD